MAHKEDLENVKAKIRKLSGMVVDNGATENEAAMAMEHVGRLLALYNLTMDEVDVAEEKCISVRVGIGTLKHAQHSWFISPLARFCGVKVWMSKNSTEVGYNFFGLEADVQMAGYLLKMITAAMKTETAKYKKTVEYISATVHRKSLSTSFVNGMVQRIGQRLNMMCAEQQTVVSASTSTGLVVFAKSKKIELAFEELGMKLRTMTTQTRTTNANASAAGRAAGERVNLNRPITASNNALRIGNK